MGLKGVQYIGDLRMQGSTKTGKETRTQNSPVVRRKARGVRERGECAGGEDELREGDHGSLSVGGRVAWLFICVCIERCCACSTVEHVGFPRSALLIRE